MAAHLGMNGFGLRPEQLETYHFMMELYASRRFRMPELEAWLRAHAITAG
jgi:hypothetical protein